MRLFVSVDLSDTLCDGIAESQKAFEGIPGLRPVDPTQAHLTIRFLGEVDPETVPELADAIDSAVRSIELDSFPMQLRSFGAFPSTEYIRVIWVGVGHGRSELTRLFHAIEGAVDPFDVASESHDFTPHVTIARVDHGGGKESIQHVLRTEDPDVGEMDVESVYLTESRLEPDGPEYSTVRTYPLNDVSSG